jgi:hypothetical protein
MEKDNRTYFVCYKLDENEEKHHCKPVGEKKNLAMFKESVDVKHICKHIPFGLQKTVFELKYSNYKIIY